MREGGQGQGREDRQGRRRIAKGSDTMEEKYTEKKEDVDGKTRKHDKNKRKENEKRDKDVTTKKGSWKEVIHEKTGNKERKRRKRSMYMFRMRERNVKEQKRKKR